MCRLQPARAHLNFDSDAEAAGAASVRDVSPSGCIKTSVASVKQERGGLWSFLFAHLLAIQLEIVEPIYMCSLLFESRQRDAASPLEQSIMIMTNKAGNVR